MLATEVYTEKPLRARKSFTLGVIKDILHVGMSAKRREMLLRPSDKMHIRSQCPDDFPLAKLGRRMPLPKMDNLFDVTGVDTREKEQQKQNGKNGEPLHLIGDNLFWEGFDDTYNPESIESMHPTFPRPEYYFYYEESKVNIHERKHMLQDQRMQNMILVWTKTLVFMLTNQSQCSIDTYAAFSMNRDLNLVFPNLSNAQELFRLSVVFQSPSLSFRAFQNGARWNDAICGIPSVQYFLASILYPTDWQVFFWACYSYLCAVCAYIPKDTGQKRTVLYDYAEMMASSLSAQKRKRLLDSMIYVTHSMRVEYSQIKKEK